MKKIGDYSKKPPVILFSIKEEDIKKAFSDLKGKLGDSGEFMEFELYMNDEKLQNISFNNVNTEESFNDLVIKLEKNQNKKDTGIFIFTP